MRYWDGERWMSYYAPPTAAPAHIEAAMNNIIWAISLAFGVAGVLAWEAPVVDYFWPLGLGGAGLSCAIVAYRKDQRTPWFGTVAVIASVIGIIMGIHGVSQLNDVRDSLSMLGS
jgi:hypothetical protein